jgi:hypothetical protein
LLKPVLSRSALVKMPPRRSARRSRSDSLMPVNEQRNPWSGPTTSLPVENSHTIHRGILLSTDGAALSTDGAAIAFRTPPQAVMCPAHIPSRHAERVRTSRSDTPELPQSCRRVEAGSRANTACRSGGWEAPGALERGYEGPRRVGAAPWRMPPGGRARWRIRWVCWSVLQKDVGAS